MKDSGQGLVRVGDSKIALARKAAVLASQTLKTEDQIGVLVFSDEPRWVVEISPVGTGADLAEVQSQISSIVTDRGTRIKPALEEGIQALMSVSVGSRHVILLSDGRDTTLGTPDYEDVILGARQQNISISTFAFGENADAELLSQLSDWGNGRFYLVLTAESLPVLMADEATRISEALVSEGIFQPELGEFHPVLSGIPLETIPDLEGYHALTPKPSAEVILRTGEGDPLLAAWQYGLGRSVAWTSDLGEVWAIGWPSWELFSRLWTQIVVYTLPDPALKQLHIATEVENRIATITVDSLDDAGRPISLADTRLAISSPDGATWELPMVEMLPGRYRQSVAVSAEGVYHLEVTQDSNQGPRQAEAGFVLGYPREYCSDESGEALLAHLADLTGGGVLTGAEFFDSAEEVASGAAASVIPIWPYLVVAAAVLWPLDIAVRRWRMPWQ